MTKEEKKRIEKIARFSKNLKMKKAVKMAKIKKEYIEILKEYNQLKNEFAELKNIKKELAELKTFFKSNEKKFAEIKIEVKKLIK